MENVVGPPVEGENFYGRTSDIARLIDVIARSDILLLGPRRIGKTSIARALIRTLRAQGWRAIEINVASCIDERSFLVKLEEKLKPELASLGTKVLGVLGDKLAALGNRIRKVSIPIPGVGTTGFDLGKGAEEDWTTVGGELLQLLSNADEPWLVYVDELPIMLFNLIRNDPANGVARVRRFLDWFRNDVRALPGAEKIRWLLTGSVGLDTLVQQHGMADTINSLNHQSLKPFDENVAVAMLSELVKSYALDWTDTACLELTRRVGWFQPYYLQAAFHHLRSRPEPLSDSNLTALIERAIDQLAEPGADNDFHHWESRLSDQLSHTNAQHARTLLTLSAAKAEGIGAASLFAALQERLPNTAEDEAKQVFVNLRDILLRDAYWVVDESSGTRRYRFHLEPLRRWWIRRNTL